MYFAKTSRFLARRTAVVAVRRGVLPPAAGRGQGTDSAYRGYQASRRAGARSRRYSGDHDNCRTTTPRAAPTAVPIRAASAPARKTRDVEDQRTSSPSPSPSTRQPNPFVTRGDSRCNLKSNRKASCAAG